MKSFCRLLGNLIIITSFLTSSCSFVPLKRVPANDPVELTHLRKDHYIQAKIYEFKGILAFPPVRWIANLVIRRKLKKFLKDLPIKKGVQKRIMAKVKSKDFMRQIVPFMLGMQELYMAKEEFAARNFDNYIKKYFPDHTALPGLKHSLFTYGEEGHKALEASGDDSKESGISKTFMAKIVTLADHVLFKDADFKLGMKPYFKEERIKGTMPVVKGLMEEILKEFKIADNYKEIVEGMINDPKRLEAMTISITELLLTVLYSNYQTMAKRYHREELLKDWMLKELKKRKDSKLWAYLKESLNERRYAVHIVVDGLQGQLTESLANPIPNDPFFKYILSEHKAKDSYKPENIKTKHTAKQQIEFLEFLNRRKRPYTHKRFLPFFKDLYKNHSSGVAITGVSTTPTISVRNIPMATAGNAVEGPGGSRLPNFHYVDREKDRAYYFFGNDALRMNDINSERGMKTIANRMPHLNTLNCNSQWGYGTDLSFDPLVNIAAGEISRDFGEIICLAELEKRLKNEKKAMELRRKILKYEKRMTHWNNTSRVRRDRGHNNPSLRVKSLVKKLAEVENVGIPSYLLIYNPWPDHFAHFTGPFADEIIGMTGELNRLDYWLGRVKKIYQKAGIYDRTMWGMAGDHGMTPIYHLLNPEVVVFDKLREEGHELIVRKISSDEGEGPKLNHPFKPESVKGVDVVIASTAGGNYMIDLFKDQEGGWEEQPVLEDIQDLQLLSGERMNLMHEIVTRLEDSLEYAVVREEECGLESADVALFRMEGDQKVKDVVRRRGERVFYRSTGDLLQVKQISHYRKHPDIEKYHDLYKKCIEYADENNVGSWCFEDEWRELTRFTIKPDSVNQIAHIYDTDLAGTINLFPKQGIGYNSKVPGRHAGEHFHEKDAFVGVWGGPVKKKERLGSVQNGSIPVVLYEFLSGTRTVKGEDGWGYDSFIHKLNIKIK